MVTNVEVDVTSNVSVRVSWTEVNITGLTAYIVYYSRERSTSEETVNVSRYFDYVEINDLQSNSEYQFQVAAMAVVDGDEIIGERSVVHDVPLLDPVGFTSTTSEG